jgi:hypothetical protein
MRAGMNAALVLVFLHEIDPAPGQRTLVTS